MRSRPSGEGCSLATPRNHWPKLLADDRATTRAFEAFSPLYVGVFSTTCGLKSQFQSPISGSSGSTSRGATEHPDGDERASSYMLKYMSAP